jgi:hypothetical protein
MAACGQPTLGMPVVEQQDLSLVGVDQDAVRHEVLRRTAGRSVR